MKVAVIDIDKVKVYGSGATGDGAAVGRPARVVADISEAGPAKVRASIKRPSGSKRSVSMKPRDKKNPHIVSGHYTPRTPGDHLLNVTFHKEPLPQSPFTVPIVCQNEPVTFGPGLSKATVNVPNVIDVFRANIKPEEVSATFATCKRESLSVPVEVERISNDHCALKYFPQSEMVGCMEADVCYAGTPIGSHLSLPVTDPAECMVSGPGAEGPLKTGEETYLNVDCAEAGPCVPTVRVTGPAGDTVDSVRTSEEPGKYKFSYMPRQDGEYCVAVCSDGTQVSGSPFSVSSSPVGISACGTTPNVKEPLELNVDLSDAVGDFDLTVTGPEKCPVRSRDNPDGTKTFSFKPTKVGIYEITATLDRKPIWKKPMKVAVIDIDKVKVYGSGVTGDGASVGRPAHVIADISEAGPATVKASIKEPSGNKRSVSMIRRDKKNPHIFSGKYYPKTTGGHIVNVSFHDMPLLHSPFLVDVCDTEKLPIKESSEFLSENTTDFEIVVPDVDRVKTDDVEAEKLSMNEALDAFLEPMLQIGSGQPSTEHSRDTDAERVLVSEAFEAVAEEVVESEIQLYGIAPSTGHVNDSAQFPVNEAFQAVPEPVVETGTGLPDIAPLNGHISDDQPLPVNEVLEAVLEPLVEAGAKHSLFEPAVASGRGLENGCVDEWTEFLLDFSRAGPGDIEVNINGPMSPETKVQIVEPGLALVKYLPTQTGTYSISVLYGGTPVSNSPFTASVSEEERKGTETIQLIAEGTKLCNPFKFSLTLSGESAGLLTAKVVGPFAPDKIPDTVNSKSATMESYNLLPPEKCHQPKVSVVEMTHNIEFIPEEVGVYFLAIFYDKRLIADSPYRFNVCDPSAVKVTGSGCEDSRDTVYNVQEPFCWQADCTRAGPGRLQMFVVGPTGCSRRVDMDPIPNQQGCYDIKYIPNVPGGYTALVAFSGYNTGIALTIHVSDPSQAAVKASTRRTARINEQVTFKVDLSSAGAGKLQASLVGPVQVPIKFNNNNDGTCTFSITPTAVGVYKLDIRFGEKALSEKPLEVSVIDPSKVRLSGPGATGIGANVGEPAIVIVDVSESGLALLDAAVTRPTGEKESIDLQPAADNENMLMGSYTPKTAGFHYLDITMDDKPIPCTPVKVFIASSEQVKLSGSGLACSSIGQPSTIDLAIDNVEDGELLLKAETESGQPVDVEYKVVKVGSGRWQLHYKLVITGVYYIVLYFNGVPITERMKVCTVDSSRVIISELKEVYVSNKQALFNVDASELGPGTVSATCIQGDESEIEVMSNQAVSAGKWTMAFTPTDIGILHLNIKFSGLSVLQHTAAVVNPSAVDCTGLDQDRLLVGENITFAVDATAAGSGAELTAEVDGPETCHFCLNAVDGNLYSGIISASTPGAYKLHIRYGGEEIKNSPFLCCFHRPEPDANQCSISDLEAVPGKFTVDCRQAGGNGILEVAAYGAYVPARMISVVHNGDYTFDVSYDIPDPVETIISVKWHGQHLKGSPFKVVFRK